MPGSPYDDIIRKVEAGAIDTILACLVDMQGRLMGKRFHARNFVRHAVHGTHCCDYLLATDLEMSTPSGYASSSWERGYGDYALHPDLSTFRAVPWLEGSAEGRRMSSSPRGLKQLAKPLLVTWKLRARLPPATAEAATVDWSRV